MTAFMGWIIHIVTNVGLFLPAKEGEPVQLPTVIQGALGHL